MPFYIVPIIALVGGSLITWYYFLIPRRDKGSHWARVSAGIFGICGIASGLLGLIAAKLAQYPLLCHIVNVIRPVIGGIMFGIILIIFIAGEHKTLSQRLNNDK
jgi:H+/Cl- antiporter ClcA